MPRIVACLMCNKIERMTDPPQGPLVPARVAMVVDGTEHEHIFRDDTGMPIMVPMYDPMMEDYVTRHSHGRADTDVIQFVKVFNTDQATWDRMDVVTEVKNELAKQTGEFFDEVDHYRTEAVKCYNAHGNPAGGCIDYCEDSKRLGRTDVPRKYQAYLCHMCPVQQSYINVELRRRKGWYDPNRAPGLQRALNARRRKGRV